MLPLDALSLSPGCQGPGPSGHCCHLSPQLPLRQWVHRPGRKVKGVESSDVPRSRVKPVYPKSLFLFKSNALTDGLKKTRRSFDRKLCEKLQAGRSGFMPVFRDPAANYQRYAQTILLFYGGTASQL